MRSLFLPPFICSSVVVVALLPGACTGEPPADHSEDASPLADASVMDAGVVADAGPVGCARCLAEGLACLEGSKCVDTCPGGRDRCPGNEGGADRCCDEGTRCCKAAFVGADRDLCLPAPDGCPVLCPGVSDACPEGTWCLAAPFGSTGDCLTTCAPSQRCGNSCCPAGVTCAGGECRFPDLVPEAVGGAPVRVTSRTVAADACEVGAGCQLPGERTVVEWRALLTNVGDGELSLDGPFLQIPACGGAPVVPALIEWRLANKLGRVVRQGTADAPCVRDEIPIMPNPRHSCARPGLSPGSSTWIRGAGPCSSVDVTGLAPGNYRLVISVNPTGRLPESNLFNNSLTLPVTIPMQSCPGHLCGDACCPLGVLCVEGGCAAD